MHLFARLATPLLLACAFLSACSSPSTSVKTPVSSVGAAPPAQKFGDATPLEWSVRMARSEMARKGDRMFLDANPEAKWSYTAPLVGMSLMRLSEQTGDPSFGAYGVRTATSFVAADGTISGYRKDEFNIDLVTPGKVLVRAWELGDHSPGLRTAIETLRDQMRNHPRTSEGGFWHKQRYPNQMWLDGLFMASPFLAHYAQTFNEPALFDDVAKQLILMDRHSWDAEKQLHHHAWDEARTQPWADKTTGVSPGFWGRSEGWYAMALVDCLEYLPVTHPDVDKITAILDRLASGIVRWQDPATGCWWQVMDQGAREGNYLEGTATAMFNYALAKGISRGYLSRAKYLPALLKGYAGMIKTLVRTDADGAVNLTQCCEVAGLGGMGKNNHVRDGTFEYYISEPIVLNDQKGVGPFISTGAELDQILRAPTYKPVSAAATAKAAKAAAKAAKAAAKTAGPGFQARGWDDYPKVLARIKAPIFPDRDFPITDFGATSGIEAAPNANTAAIAAAIAAANKAGGGRVVVPVGVWRTGAVHLKSNVNLHVAKDATLLFSTNPADYPIVRTRWEGTECMNYSALIYAFEQTNIGITGEGTLDGGATAGDWWSWNKKGDKPQKQKPARDRLVAFGETDTPVEQRVFGDGCFLRPNFLQPYRCQNVLIEGVTILRSPMWVTHPAFCTNVTVRGLTIHSHGGNNDGCDPESSRDVLIENCVFDTGDDCIAIKSGRNGDGRRLPIASENLVVRGCTMKDGHGGVVLGSECSAGIRNVFVENCTMDSTELDRALRFKSNAVRGGVLENVFMRDVKIGRVGEAVLTIDLLYEEGAKGDFMPTVRNVQLDRVTATATPRVLFVRGFKGAVIDDIRISDCVFSGLTASDVVKYAGSVTFRNVAYEPAEKVKSKNSVGTQP
jgi:unsaturated rhamnogalacturonyl hydrolase